MGTTFSRREFIALGLSALTTQWLSGCAVGMQSVEADMAMGHEIAREVEKGLGIVPPDGTTAYLKTVGQNLADVAADQPFHFSYDLVDQQVPNAFAAPGGWTYYTRGLIMLTNTEDELAAVIGHEMSHVIHRHTARQLAKSRAPSILRLPGNIVGRVLSRDLGNLINAPVDALGTAYIARNSRKDEYEADRGGQLLAARAGYDPAALAAVLLRIEEYVEYETGERRIPSFFDSHPSTPDRLDQVYGYSAQLQRAAYRGVTDNARAHLNKLDGMIVGENPANGIIQNRRFMHPDLMIAVDYPEGWLTMNTHEAVVAMSAEKDALIAFGVAGRGDNPSRVAAAFETEMKRQYNVDPSRSEDTTINGMPASVLIYTDESDREPVHLGFAWIAYNGLIYQYMAVAPENQRKQLAGIVGSFRPLTRKEREAFTVVRLKIVAAGEKESIDKLAQRSGSVWDAKMIAAVNGIDSTEILSQGQFVKIAVQQAYD